MFDWWIPKVERYKKPKIIVNSRESRLSKEYMLQSDELYLKVELLGQIRKVFMVLLMTMLNMLSSNSIGFHLV